MKTVVTIFSIALLMSMFTFPAFGQESNVTSSGGTNNYIPIFDDTHSIEDSTFRLNGKLLEIRTDSSWTSGIEIGLGGTANRYSYIDLVGDGTYTDWGLRLIRNNTGANTDSWLQHRGTGILYLSANDAGSIQLRTNGSTRLTIDSSGNVGIGDTTPDYKLDVEGTIGATGIWTDSSTVPNIVGGHSSNYVDSGKWGVAISGGGSAAGGIYRNQAYDSYAAIGGGFGNVERGYCGAISGGIYNEVDAGGDYGSVGGGRQNYVYGEYGVVAGGYQNGSGYSSEDYATIGGGYSNWASDYASTIPGGYNNTASADYTFAAGSNATADDVGSFVWADSDSSCYSTTTDQFMVCADGGAYFSHNVSALSFTDRTPYPPDLETAYGAVLSMRRLPDGEYDPRDESMQLDHSSLTNFVLSVVDDEGHTGRNLSATVSAQNEVIKDLTLRVAQLEQKIGALETIIANLAR